jgi:hypothetical protein
VVLDPENGPIRDVEYFLWLAANGLQVGLFLTPYLALLGATGLITALVANGCRPGVLARKWRWLNLPFLLPPLILAYGVAFRYAGGRSSSSGGRTHWSRQAWACSSSGYPCAPQP